MRRLVSLIDELHHLPNILQDERLGKLVNEIHSRAHALLVSVEKEATKVVDKVEEVFHPHHPPATPSLPEAPVETQPEPPLAA